jgi:hypothetical protein
MARSTPVSNKAVANFISRSQSLQLFLNPWILLHRGQKRHSPRMDNNDDVMYLAN